MKGVDTCEGKEAVVKRHFMIRRPFYFYSYGKFPGYYCPLTFSSLEKKKNSSRDTEMPMKGRDMDFHFKQGYVLGAAYD